jgi:tetratricopeptide (TPR) repeat protein
MLRLLFFAFICVAVYTQQSPPAGNPSLASAHALFKQGKFPEAATAYRAVLESDKSSVPAYAGLVQSYLKADDLTAADEASTQAMAALPRSALIHAVRGDVHFRNGLLADAENEYRAALKLDEKCARALLGMGKIYSAASNSQRAGEYFAQAHELDPDDGDALYRWAALLPYPQSVQELEKHLAEYHSWPEDDRREREFIELVRGVGNRETWVGPKDMNETEIRLEPLVPRPGAVLGLGLHVKFNHTVNATLLLDTGASWMTISRSLAEKIGARKISDYAIEGVGDSGPATGYFAWVDKIIVGNVEFRDCVVHVAMRSNPAGLDGVTGTNIFTKYLLTIDFPGRKLVLTQPVSVLEKGERLVQPVIANDIGASYSFGHILLLSTLVNNSAAGLFVLDSGANISSISPQIAKQVAKLHEAGSRISGSSGEVSKVSLLPDVTLKFSPAPAPRQDLAAFDPHSLSRQLGTEVSGFIGFDMLNRMKVRIDYQHGKVDFEPAKH